MQVSEHTMVEPGGATRGGERGGNGGERGGGGEATGAVRGPQSTQSVPTEQTEYSAPGPPSSQSLSLALEHVLVHRQLVVHEAEGGLELVPERGPQSVQSVPRLQSVHSDPGPPSSHQRSLAYTHESKQVCALAKPTIRAKKRKRAGRGAELGAELEEWVEE